MNWAQFKDPVSHMCLAGTVVVSWSLTQEVASSNPFIVMTNIFSLNSENSVKTLRENLNVLDVTPSPFISLKVSWNCHFVMSEYIQMKMVVNV